MPTPNNALTTAFLPRGVALPAGRVAGGLFLQQVSESAKGDGVDVFHASIEKNFRNFEMATDGKTSCHHFPETV